MRKNSDSRAGSRSRDKVLAAVIELLDEVAPEQITLTGIAERAGVTRPTVYAAFDDLPSAFAEAALTRLREGFVDAGISATITDEDRPAAMEDAFVDILRRLDEHSAFFSRVLRGPGGQQVLDRMVEFIAERVRTSSPVSPALQSGHVPAHDASVAIAAGVVWSMRRWVDESPRRTQEEMAARLRDLVLYSVVGGLGGSGA